MKITMAEGLEVTQEILDVARGYNWFTVYINSYSDRVNAERKNLEIENKLDELGVINFEQ
jgi:hypothetical protein